MYSSIPEMFYLICQKYGSQKPAFKYKQNGIYVEFDYSKLWDRIEKFAIGLLNLGIRNGDRVGIVSENRIEWAIVDVAISTIGAITVPIFPSTTPKQEEYIFNNCQAIAVIVSNSFQLNKILGVVNNVPSIRHIIILDNIEVPNEIAILAKTYDSIIEMGTTLMTQAMRSQIITQSIWKIKPEDILTIIYTSGTTGEPKGVVLTHKNVISNVIASAEVIKFGEDDVFLSFLPWCHSYERTTGYYAAFYCGAVIALAESIDTIPTNIKEIQPTLMTTVPKLLEVIKKRIFSAMEKESLFKRKIFFWAIKVGKGYITSKLKGTIHPLMKSKYKLADRLVFSKIRDKFGLKFLRFVSGGAPLNPEVNLFFWSLGYQVFEGYGLTEASPVVCANRDGDTEIGTVGKPLNGVEIKIADDGEILVRGPNVMQGYWNDPLATKEAIDEDGWLHTGDVGVITQQGNLKITDRKKYIFVNSGGKNIAPQPIENLLCQSKYIDQCVLIGDNREYNTALILPNFDELKRLAETFDIRYDILSELVTNPKIIRTIRDEIDYLQKDLSKFERVRKFALLTESFTVDGGELSPKLSIKRNVVEQKYSELIEQMYKIKE